MFTLCYYMKNHDSRLHFEERYVFNGNGDTGTVVDLYIAVNIKFALQVKNDSTVSSEKNIFSSGFLLCNCSTICHAKFV